MKGRNGCFPAYVYGGGGGITIWVSPLPRTEKPTLILGRRHTSLFAQKHGTLLTLLMPCYCELYSTLLEYFNVI